MSTHILDTSVGRPAEGVAVSLAARTGRDAEWAALGGSATDADGRCKDLPALPEGPPTYGSTSRPSRTSSEEASRGAAGRPRERDSGAFFPEVAITFAVDPGEHYHVPLLLNPFGYSVYRGS